jgi:hypothetical protein
MNIFSDKYVEKLALLNAFKECNWYEIEKLCDSRPHLFHGFLHILKRQTALHEICQYGSAPYHLLMKIFHTWKQAASIPNKYGDTPLHIACRRSQISSEEVQLLTQHCPTTKILCMTNNLNHTSLATACISAASFTVIETLVQANRKALFIRDFNGLSPIELLWGSFYKTVPGSVSLQGFIQGQHREMNNILYRFWKKFTFCVLHTYIEEGHAKDMEQAERRLCHAIISQNIVPSSNHLLATALTIDYTLGFELDDDGNTPLHILTCKKRGMPSALVLLNRCKDSVKIINNCGRIPLHNAILEGVPWSDIKHYLRAAPDTFDCVDPVTMLDPFMLAATVGDVNLTYQLLISKPDVISHYAYNNTS